MKMMQGIRFYRRTGRMVSKKKVEAVKHDCAEEYRYGKGFHNKNERMADAIDAMTLQRFCNWSGLFTYRVYRDGYIVG